MAKTNTSSRTLTRGTIALAVIAVVLLLASGIGTAQAALTYFSETYAAQVELPSIGVSLVENGDVVAESDFNNDGNNFLDVSNNPDDPTLGILTSKMIPEGEQLMLGRTYDERLSVKNSGNIDEYVRVRVFKYWIGPDGKKTTKLSPKLIDLKIKEGNGWVENADERTTERNVLYYMPILPVGSTTPEFTESLTIDGSIAAKVKQETSERVENGIKYTTVKTTYDYNGCQFIIRAEVDAVQTHNAVDAIRSAWGVDVGLAADGSYSLK